MTNAEVMSKALATATGKPEEGFKKVLDAIPPEHRKDLDNECKDAEKLLKRMGTAAGKRVITNWLIQGLQMSVAAGKAGKFPIYTAEDGGRLYILDPLVDRWGRLELAVKNRPSDAMADVTLLLHLIGVLISERQEALEYLEQAEERIKLMELQRN